MKVVISERFGGFGLSIEAQKRLYELKDPHQEVKTFEEYHKGSKPFSDSYLEDAKFLGQAVLDGERLILDNHSSTYGGKDMVRACPLLLQVVEELGSERASGRYAELKIVEVPDGVEFCIDEYDGNESIHEKHRSWR